MTPAPDSPTQAAAEPVSSVALIMTSSTPASRNLGHQRVRRVRAKGAALRRAGLSTVTAGRPSGPGTGSTAGLSLSRRRDHRVISCPAKRTLLHPELNLDRRPALRHQARARALSPDHVEARWRWHGGLPRAQRAWPLAWPSPSGPLGAAEAP